MRRVLSLLLLLATTAWPAVPLRCAAAGHEGHEGHVKVAVHMPAAHGDHSVHVDGVASRAAAPSRDTIDTRDGADQPDPDWQCTDGVMCHWVAMPAPQTVSTQLAGMPAAGDQGAPTALPASIHSLPTPPPRQIS